MFWLIIGMFAFCKPDTVLIYAQKDHPDFKLFSYLDRFVDLDIQGKRKMIGGGQAWLYGLYVNDDGTYVFGTGYPEEVYVIHGGEVIAQLPDKYVSYFGGVWAAFLGDCVYIAGRPLAKTLFRVHIPTGEIDTIKGILTGGFVKTDQRHGYIILGGIPEDIAKKLHSSPYRHLTAYNEDLEPVAVIFGGQDMMTFDYTFRFSETWLDIQKLHEEGEKGGVKIIRFRTAIKKPFDAILHKENSDCSPAPYLEMDKYNNLYVYEVENDGLGPGKRIYRINPYGILSGMIYIDHKNLEVGQMGVIDGTSPGGSYYMMRIEGQKGNWRLVVLKWDKKKFDDFCK